MKTSKPYDVATYQKIADRLLEKHYGLQDCLGDLGLDSEDRVSLCIKADKLPYHLVNLHAENCDIGRMDLPGFWGIVVRRDPLTEADELAALGYIDGSELSPLQEDALLSFRERHGKAYKDALNSCWQKASYPGMSTDHAAGLQQIRNHFGPKWLLDNADTAIKNIKAERLSNHPDAGNPVPTPSC